MRRTTQHLISFLVLFCIPLTFLLSSCAGAGSAGSGSSTTLSFNLNNSSGRSISRATFSEGDTLDLVIGGDFNYHGTAQFDANGKAHLTVEDVPVGANIYAVVGASSGGGFYLGSCQNYTVKDGNNYVHISMEHPIVNMYVGDRTSPSTMELAIPDNTVVTFKLSLDVPEGISCMWSLGVADGSISSISRNTTSSTLSFTAGQLYSSLGDGSTYTSGWVNCSWTVGSFTGSSSSNVTGSSSDYYHLSSGS